MDIETVRGPANLGPFQLEFFAYETMGAACYSEWAMSVVPIRYKRPHDWRPFGWARRPLKLVGILRDREEPGVFYEWPRWLAGVVSWRPLSGLAYRWWVRDGRPGHLQKLNFDL